MTEKAPPLDQRTADDIVRQVETKLAQYGWRKDEADVGWTLVRLFGRLAELVINRLNQIPDRHFLAFLNEAGIDLLPPRGALTELTFTPIEDGPEAIVVPAGTQAATLQSETQPEIVFETSAELVVVQSKLTQVITVDPLSYAVRTEEAQDLVRPFPLLRGEDARRRILYIGDERLFSFPDDASRESAIITLKFALASPGDPAFDGWTIEWLYWDGADWTRLTKAGAIIKDGTENFRQDGDVTFRRLPHLGATDIGLLFSVMPEFQEDLTNGMLGREFRERFAAHRVALSDDVVVTVQEEGRVWQIRDLNSSHTFTARLGEMLDIYFSGARNRWLAAEMKGGTARRHLPIVQSILGSRSIRISHKQIATVDGAFSAVQANTTFVPLDLNDQFFPLGQRPGYLDTFYIMSNEAFAKAGATVSLEMKGLESGLDQLAISEIDPKRLAELNRLKVVWEYYSNDGWKRMGTSVRVREEEKGEEEEEDSEETSDAVVGSERLGFQDTTNAFTTVTSDGQASLIRFAIPGPKDADPMFASTVVNGLEGYWIRARIVDGSYNLAAFIEKDPESKRNENEYIFHEAVSYAPLITGLQVVYSGYAPPEDSALPVGGCRSKIDQTVRVHPVAADNDAQFGPFCTENEGPALYLGIHPALPAGRWIRLLFDLKAATEEEQAGRYPDLYWEYWDGTQWSALSVSDDTRGFRVRGYIGFFAPFDHRPSNEFGRTAHWIRVRTPQTQPVAQAGHDQAIHADPAPTTVRLDASGSRALACQNVARYRWRYLSLVADAGRDRRVLTGGDTGEVELDATDSIAAGARSIARYHWRIVTPTPTELVMPQARSIRFNTIAARNAITNLNEILGSSDGKPNQSFDLARFPVLFDIELAVLEPDRPPDQELALLRRELREVDEEAEPLIDGPEAAAVQGQWVRWRRVDSFDHSTAQSRHFVLDPDIGQVRFGDGKRGKIPPIQRNNIKALRYRHHNARRGNLERNEITVLRNPVNDLANIDRVTNLEPAIGGADAESVESVKERGPQRLKNRQRSVTLDDYQWIARDMSDEVAYLYGLPRRKFAGLNAAGRVSTVLVPRSEDPRPIPNPGLLRRIKEHLAEHALANLGAGFEKLSVVPPEFVEVNVAARVVPVDPLKADEAEQEVRTRLSTFLHPLHGGPQRAGWTLGRDVYLSEIHTEIENVSKVDYVAELTLTGSVQQQRIHLARGLSAYGIRPGMRVSIKAVDGSTVADDLIITTVTEEQARFEPPFALPDEWNCFGTMVASTRGLHLPFSSSEISLENDGALVNGINASYPTAPYDLPSGSQVSTFDERIKLKLAEPFSQGMSLNNLPVSGFKAGDRIAIVAADNAIFREALTIAHVAVDQLDFAEPLGPLVDEVHLPDDLVIPAAVLSSDGDIRIPIAGAGFLLPLTLRNDLNAEEISDDLRQALNMHLARPLSKDAALVADDDETRWHIVDARNLYFFIIQHRAEMLRVTLRCLGDWQEDGLIGRAKLKGFEPGDTLSIVAGGRRDPSLEFLPIERITHRDDRIYVPDGALVYSGAHNIKMVLE